MIGSVAMLAVALALPAAPPLREADGKPRGTAPSPSQSPSPPWIVHEYRLTANGGVVPCGRGDLVKVSDDRLVDSVHLVASGLRVAMQGGAPGASSGPGAWCATTRRRVELPGKGRITGVAVHIRYRLARRGKAAAQLIARVNGESGLAVATDPFGTGVLKVLVPQGRLVGADAVEIALTLEADRANSWATVAAEVREVVVVVDRAATAQSSVGSPLAAKP